LSSPPLLAISGLSKRYCRDLRRSFRYALQDVAADLAGAGGEKRQLRKGEFWALDDISFSLDRGQSLAIVGDNGSGKSTLLKIIYGLLKPDSGEVRIAGSVGAIIELGSNLSPLLTGRENIELGSAAHGLSAREARALMDAIVDFAAIGDAVGAPLQSYSSGMKARLAFALAVHFRPDLLLVDEVLAVGDIEFQRKCIEWMRRYLAEGGSLIFVSHILQQVQLICSRGILLEKGRAVQAGSTSDVVRRYLERSASILDQPPAAMEASARLLVESIEILHRDGKVARSGEDAFLRMRVNAREPLTAYCGVTIWTADGSTCITSSFDHHGRAIAPGKNALDCLISRLPLVPGRYIARPVVADREALVAIPLAGPAAAGIIFQVAGDPDLFSNGQLQMGQLIAVDADWNFQQSDAASELPAQPA
jgi:lipopolysaccharide transport system ATP-binding protein